MLKKDPKNEFYSGGLKRGSMNSGFLSILKSPRISLGLLITYWTCCVNTLKHCLDNKQFFSPTLSNSNLTQYKACLYSLCKSFFITTTGVLRIPNIPITSSPNTSAPLMPIRYQRGMVEAHSPSFTYNSLIVSWEPPDSIRPRTSLEIGTSWIST